jgi:ERCC4-type nuclease
MQGGYKLKGSPRTSGIITRNPKYLTPYNPKPIVFPKDFCLVVDTREQASPLFIDHPPKGLMVMRDTLKNGDYGIRGYSTFAIEKKYYGDLFPYCSTERDSKTTPKMKSFTRLIGAGGWVGLVIENRESDIFKWQEYTNISPESVRGALLSFAIRYHVHIYFAATRESAADWILRHAVKFYEIQNEF